MSLDTQGKMEIAKQKKDTGDQAFKIGNVTDALRSYHEALLYLKGIDKSGMAGLIPSANDTDPAKRTEADELLEKIYSNQSACYIKNENWKRALETAEKALAKNENNHKAAFRKGKALAHLGFVSKAEQTLGDLLKKNPDGAASITQELARIKAADAESQKEVDQKLRGFLSREKDKVAPKDTTTTTLSPAETP